MILKQLFLAHYLLQAMLAWVPLSQHSFYEKKNSSLLRYSSIALASSETILDKKIAPVFDNDEDKVKTSLLLVSIPSSETGFVKSAVECFISGDNGQAWGPWQTHTPKKETCNNLLAAAGFAMNYITISFDWCKKLPLQDRLSGYTDGKCRSSSESQRKVGRALSWYNAHKPDTIHIY